MTFSTKTYLTLYSKSSHIHKRDPQLTHAFVNEHCKDKNVHTKVPVTLSERPVFPCLSSHRKTLYNFLLMAIKTRSSKQTSSKPITISTTLPFNTLLHLVLVCSDSALGGILLSISRWLHACCFPGEKQSEISFSLSDNQTER